MIYLASLGIYSIGKIGIDATFNVMAAMDRAAREADIAAFDAASRDRQERRRRERQAGAGEQSCPPSPEAGGARGKPPGAPPANLTDADDEDPGLDPSKIPIFRGGTDMTARPFDVKIDKASGLLHTTRGISVGTNAGDLAARFGSVSRIGRLPQGLRIVQRGSKLGHYEIVPTRPMTPAEYQALLNSITFM